MRMAKEAGFDGFEPAFNEKGPISLESTEAELQGYRKLADDIGIELASLASGLYWQYPMTAEDPAIRAKSLEITRAQLKAAKALGVDAILVVPGYVQAFNPKETPVPYDVAYDRALAGLKSLAPYAEELGVTIGVENVWNKFLLSPLEMRDFIDKIGSPCVKAYFDIGNVIQTGFPEQWIDILGSRIVRCHCKDYKASVGTLSGFVDLLAGDVNYPAVMEALARIGYDGYITAEMGAYKHHSDLIVYNTSAAMDRIFGRK